MSVRLIVLLAMAQGQGAAANAPAASFANEHVRAAVYLPDPDTGYYRGTRFWAVLKTACPEPYIDASVEPGGRTSWRITYAFYDAKLARVRRGAGK